MEKTMKAMNMKRDWALLASCALAITAGILSACSEETEKDYAYEERMLEITVCDKTLDATTRAAYRGLTTTFEEGDAIGIYVVDGSTAVYSNVKYTLTNGQWVTAEKCPYNSRYAYYAYYPYTEMPATPSFSASGDEDSKFATMISSWTVTGDQGTLEKFRSNDLMIAKGMPASGRAVHFTMKHKMALAVLDSDVATFSYDTDPDTRYDIAMTFGDMTPYFDGANYFLFMRPDELTAIGGQQLKAGKGYYITGSRAALTADYTMTFSTDGGSTFTSLPPSWLKGVVETKEPDSEAVNFIVSASDEKTTDIVKSRTPMKVTKDYIAEGLKEAEPVADRDLSLYKNDGTQRGSRTTANCYLVHNPGTYRIPLVYGNAIKNGADNKSAYQASVTGDNILQDLVRHDNRPIIAPWIKDNGITVDGAELVWQDVKGLITEVGIDGDYLTFTISQEDINAGNAVIAAKAGETIVWSWHIWATEETLDDLTEIDTGSHTNMNGEPAPYRVAPVNVGQVPTYDIGDGQEVVYAGSSCIVRINVSNGTTMTFTVTQPDHTDIVATETPLYSRSPYYQWGRKDAFIPGWQQSRGYYNYPTWDIEGTLLTSESSGRCYSLVADGNTIGETIQHPDCFYSNANNEPYDEHKNNYWNINQNDYYSPGNNAATKKTVYDPCPPGFCVPTSDLIDFLSNGARQTMYLYYTQVSWDNATKTLTWLGNGANLIFPTSNMRNRLSVVSESFPRGYYWSATPSANYSQEARAFFINDAYCGYGISKHYRSHGYSIRPVAEE